MPVRALLRSGWKRRGWPHASGGAGTEGESHQFPRCPEPSGPFPPGKLTDVGEGSTRLSPESPHLLLVKGTARDTEWAPSLRLHQLLLNHTSRP